VRDPASALSTVELEELLADADAVQIQAVRSHVS
jgi:hypothetical protein